jgi:hypothetical protein
MGVHVHASQEEKVLVTALDRHRQQQRSSGSVGRAKSAIAVGLGVTPRKFESSGVSVDIFGVRDTGSRHMTRYVSYHITW